MRPSADWCSLCYFSLRPRPEWETQAAGVPRPGTRGAPLVEAALEPGRSDWNAIAAAHDVVDAELVDAGSAAATWPCTCGAAVSIEQDACPDCGRGFLAELRDSAAGKHRRGHRPAALQSGLLGSRRVRLTIAALVSLVFAVAIPVVLALFG